MKKTLTLALCIAVVILAGPVAQAATITWEAAPELIGDRVAGTPTGWGDARVRTDGTTVIAHNVRDINTGTLKVVNGVSFEAVVRIGGDLPLGMNGSYLTRPTTTYQDGDVSANFEYVLDSFAFGNPARELQFTGLTDGQDYLIQFFTSDRRVTTNNRFVEFDDDTNTTNGTSTRVTQRRGYSHVGTFTADAATQTVWVRGYTTIDGTAGTAMAVSAVQIREVPEPATMSLLALGGIAMLKRRKK